MSRFVKKLCIFILLSSIFSQNALKANLDTIRIRDVTHHISQAEQNLSVSYSLALRHAQIARQLSVLENDTVRFQATNTLARVCFYVDLLDHAANSWTEALKIAEALGDAKLQARTQFNLSALYIALKDYQKAYAYFKSSKAYYTSADNPEGLSPEVELNLVNNEAIILNELGYYSEAQELYRLGIGIALKNNLQAGHKKILNAYIGHLLDKEQYEEALELVQESLKLHPDQENNAINYSRMGKIYWQSGKLEEAEHALLISVQLSRELGLMEILQRSSKILFELYSHLERPNAPEFKALADSILNIKRAQDAEAKHLLAMNELRKDFETYSKRLALQEQENTRIKFKLAVSVSLVFLVILILVVYRLRTSSSPQKPPAQTLTPEMSNENNASSASIQKDDLNSKVSIAEISSLLQSQQPKSIGDEKMLSDIKLRLTQIDSEFYSRLMSSYPSLSTNERRLCSFLRLDMSTKEIVSVTGQSLRAVQIARSRLRKKLNLDPSENLNAFLRTF